MRDRGFTLMELPVVLAIVGMVLATLPSGLGAVLPGMKFHAAARELATALRGARVLAVTGGAVQAVALVMRSDPMSAPMAGGSAWSRAAAPTGSRSTG